MRTSIELEKVGIVYQLIKYITALIILVFSIKIGAYLVLTRYGKKVVQHREITV